MNKELMIAAAVLFAVVLLAIFDGAGMPGMKGVTKGTSTPVEYSRASKKSSSSASTASSKKSCYHGNIELKGKVQIVDSFPDLKIQYVSAFSDIDVQFVSSFPSDCGKWQLVDSFPDFKVQVVSSFPDIKVKKVSAFPGMN